VPSSFTSTRVFGSWKWSPVALTGVAIIAWQSAGECATEEKLAGEGASLASFTWGSVEEVRVYMRLFTSPNFWLARRCPHSVNQTSCSFSYRFFGCSTHVNWEAVPSLWTQALNCAPTVSSSLWNTSPSHNRKPHQQPVETCSALHSFTSCCRSSRACRVIHTAFYSWSLDTLGADCIHKSSLRTTSQPGLYSVNPGRDFLKQVSITCPQST
jgi:hypothetical protein